MHAARDYLYSWNRFDNSKLARVRIEDDIRDALQSVRAVRPSIQQRQHLLELSARVGIRFSFIGFPAASRREKELCSALVHHISKRRMVIEPVLMARAAESDIRPILEIRECSSCALTADIFISTSALRLKVEGWTLDAVLAKLRSAARFASRNGLKFRISIEDATRTAPAALARVIEETIGWGAAAITICDTVGECLPSGASRVTGFVAELIERRQAATDIVWHGHNDKGLSLANALAAIDAGANIISGTFTGVGERTGNVPLEQLIFVLTESGNRLYDLHGLMQLCHELSASLKIEMPPNLPIIGRDAFATSTGVHAAAILKARQIGHDFEDCVYSGVSAAKLGRMQTLLIGPNSGHTAIRAALEQASIPVTEDRIAALLHRCKTLDQCIESTSEISDLVELIRVHV